MGSGRNVYPFTFVIPNTYVSYCGIALYIQFVFNVNTSWFGKIEYCDFQLGSFPTETCLHRIKGNGVRSRIVYEHS